MTSDGEGAHSTEQGLRVHYLANLGGLVALAGLDMEPPDFLLGALLSIARETGALGPEQRAEIAAMGQVKLDERATASARGPRGIGRGNSTASHSRVHRFAE